MLDGIRLKALRRELIKKDEEISVLKERNSVLEKSNAELQERTDREMEKVKEAAGKVRETIKEYRDMILEVERLHQKFLRLTGETTKINEAYRAEFNDLVADARKAKEGK